MVFLNYLIPLHPRTSINYLHPIFTCSGKTVIFSIHQPSSDVYAMFEHLLILSEGNQVYNGKTNDVISFFGSCGFKCPNFTNPADFFLKIVNTDFEDHGDVSEIVEAFKKSENLQNIQKQIEESQNRESDKDGDFKVHYSRRTRNWFIQCYYLTKRNLINAVINPGIYWVRIFMYFILSLMIGSLYYKDNDKITDQSLVPILFYVQVGFEHLLKF